MRDILGELIARNVDHILLQIWSLVALSGGCSLHRCRQVCKSWNEHIIQLVWRTKVGRDKIKQQLKWRWENVTPANLVVDFWDEMYMEPWSLALDNDLLVCGLTRFAESGAKVIERSSGTILNTLKVDPSFLLSVLPPRISQQNISPENMRHGAVYMVKIGCEIIVTVADIQFLSKGFRPETAEQYSAISIWRKDDFQLVKVIWEQSDVTAHIHADMMDLSQDFLIYMKFINDGFSTECICINLKNDYERIVFHNGDATIYNLNCVKILNGNILNILSNCSDLATIKINMWNPSSGQCLSSKELGFPHFLELCCKEQYSLWNQYLLFGIVTRAEIETETGLEDGSRFFLCVWNVDTGDSRVIEDLKDFDLMLRIINIDENFIYSITETQGLTRMTMWRRSEAVDAAVERKDMWETTREIENDSVSLDGLAIDHKSVVSVSNCGSTIRTRDFWH